MVVERVEVYDVNGYLVCAKEHKDLKDYLSDIPREYYHMARYLGMHYVIGCGDEFITKRCIELRHMKYNMIFHSEDSALQQVA